MASTEVSRRPLAREPATVPRRCPGSGDLPEHSGTRCWPSP